LKKYPKFPFFDNLYIENMIEDCPNIEKGQSFYFFFDLHQYLGLKNYMEAGVLFPGSKAFVLLCFYWKVFEYKFFRQGKLFIM